MKKLLFAVSGLLLAMAVNAQTITSPDGNIKVNLSVNGEGTPCYNITYKDAVVIQDSPLGLATSVGDFTKGLTLQKAGEPTKVEGSYDLTNGKKAHFTFSANELTVTYAQGNNPAFDVTFHVDNDNVAFRYMLHKQGRRQDRLSCMVNTEITAFIMPQGTKTFLCPQMGPQGGFARTAPSYETYYEYDAEMGKNGQGRGYTFPALFREEVQLPAATNTALLILKMPSSVG